MQHISTNEREERLHAAAHKYIHGRYKVVAQSPTAMTLTPAHRGINIAIDIILIFLFAGLWIFVMILEWALGMYSTISVTVDTHGQTAVSGRPPLMRWIENKQAEQERTP